MSKKTLQLDKSHRLLAPRIAYLVTSIDKGGIVNAAPFSNVTSVSTDPQRLVLSVYKEWDTIRNIQEVGQFVVNVPSKHLLRQIWICGDKYAGHPIPSKVNELEIAGLEAMPSEKVQPPRVKDCFGHLECEVQWIKDVGNHFLVLGDIVAASYTEGCLDENMVQVINKTLPLLEVCRGYFTSPADVVEVDRETIKNEVNGKLAQKGIRVPPEIKKYEKLKISEK
ncbi:MAG: flavin reductase family protein [bacterium]|nr:flavin reductase family protein [bacterium]